MRFAGRAVLVTFLATLACGRSEPRKAAKTTEQCFGTHQRTSAAAAEVFAQSNLQGGGDTWEAILNVVVRRYGTAGETWTKPSPMGFGAAVDIVYRGTPTWYALDAEGDGATFCAGDPGLFHDVSAEFERLNRDPAALDSMLDQAAEYELE